MNKKVKVKFNFLIFFSFCTFCTVIDVFPERIFALMSLLSILTYYTIQVKNKENNESNTAIFFIFVYTFILVVPISTFLINKIILFVLLLIYIIEEIFSLVLYRKKYVLFSIGFYSIFLVYSFLILYFKEKLPILSLFNDSVFIGSHKNLILSLLLYLFVPFVIRHLLLRRLSLNRNFD